MSAAAPVEVNRRRTIIDYQLTIIMEKARVTIIYNSNMIWSPSDDSAYLSGTNPRRRFLPARRELRRKQRRWQGE
jgi:hypothetical protein